MLKMFASNHVVLLILVLTTAIDASRIFYFPLPKIHSSPQAVQPADVAQEAPKKTAGDEFIPSEAIDREEVEKRGDDFDWEAWLDQKAATKRRITVNEVLPENLKRLLELQHSSNEPMTNPVNDLSELQATVEKTSQLSHEHFLEEPWLADSVIGRAERLQSSDALNSIQRKKHRNNTLFIVVVGVCCAVGAVGLVAAAIFWYKVQKRAEEAVDAEYPSYGVTGPNSNSGKISPSSTMSDRKLAQSAQMYHYQQQRQQMMAQEKAHLDTKPVHSDDSDDEAPEGGDYTVYECPGLAPTGEMEVRNPLFAEPDSSMISSGSSVHSAGNTPYSQLSTSMTSSSPSKENAIP